MNPLLLPILPLLTPTLIAQGPNRNFPRRDSRPIITREDRLRQHSDRFLFQTRPAHRSRTETLKITLAAGTHDRTNTPVRLPVSVPKAFAEAREVSLKGRKGVRLVGQLTAPGLLADPEPAGRDMVARELHFILPSLEAGRSLPLEVTLSHSKDLAGEESFAWRDTLGESTELRFGARPVLRYMYKALDESSKEARDLTYKVFHHLYDPSGTRLVTKGAGGLFPHHRGLYYGFNKVSYGGGKTADVWHATGDAHQSHAGFLASEAGPVLGRHRVAIHWHGPGKEVFAREERELTVYRVPGGQLVEFASRLASRVGPVKLDGDPQHAGFHFRADNEVAETTKGQTYYLRPDGAGKPGETRNWPAQQTHVNLPWDAMSFVLGGRRYTAVYLDRPSNPKEARFSERDYGRFGSYFEYELDEKRPLEVSYRIWLQEGDMTAPLVAARAADFVEPVEVRTK